MRVFIDTNVLISAALDSEGTPFRAFVKATSEPNQGMICDQNILELRRVFQRKFPNHIAALEAFLSIAIMDLELIRIPQDEVKEESLVRDISDRPILRAAVFGKADVLLTGDKDLLEANIEKPLALTPAEFLKL
jgi:putative PIN family toxin of toxin-antitoxin system